MLAHAQGQGRPRRLDPAIHGSNDEFIISQAIFNNLVRMDPKLTPRPELASEWSASPDGKVWTFKLRRGVKFHHGREFTSKDVEFTVKRLLDPATASIGRSLFALVQGVETPDGSTVRFTLAIVKPSIDAATAGAVSYGVPTHAWHDFIKGDPPLLTGIPHTPRLVVFGGGYPIREGDQVIGAIGVSGGHYSQDMECATAALGAIGAPA